MSRRAVAKPKPLPPHDKVVRVNEDPPAKARKPKPVYYLIAKLDFVAIGKFIDEVRKFRLTTALLITIEVYTPGLKHRFVSGQQSRLMWQWHCVWAKFYGEVDKLDVHREFKRQFILPILLQDDAELERLWTLSIDEGLERTFLDRIHHRDCEMADVAEALKLYEIDAAKQGCLFPKPAYRWQALMEKRGEV